MSGKKPSNAMFDPFKRWREYLDQSEQRLNDQMNKVMGTPEYNQASQQYMQAFLGMQKTMHDVTQKYLEAMNLPSRDDIAALGERLSVIEQRLASMEKKLSGAPSGSSSAATKGAASAARPRRTRKPASAATKDDQK